MHYSSNLQNQTPKIFFLFSRYNAYFSSESRSSPFILYMINRLTPAYQTTNPSMNSQFLARMFRGWRSSFSSYIIRARDKFCYGVGIGFEPKGFFTIGWPLKFLVYDGSIGFGGFMSESSKFLKYFFMNDVTLRIIMVMINQL